MHNKNLNIPTPNMKQIIIKMNIMDLLKTPNMDTLISKMIINTFILIVNMELNIIKILKMRFNLTIMDLINLQMTNMNHHKMKISILQIIWVIMITATSMDLITQQTRTLLFTFQAQRTTMMGMDPQ